ncbi:uncharacterized protein LOC123444348 [Hordeum vulgare subsp. vulgare]|uniref:uncharacterized protein LOC123444348 n=1 Tax=Hordeum vulgare subsp. vulgare TaxID=112509 RepID=UPI001D1A33FE|nr:uncharacterized protein LOC123444348 [Hordeum vulgare subsp. vulgare]
MTEGRGRARIGEALRNPINHVHLIIYVRFRKKSMNSFLQLLASVPARDRAAACHRLHRLASPEQGHRACTSPPPGASRASARASRRLPPPLERCPSTVPHAPPWCAAAGRSWRHRSPQPSPSRSCHRSTRVGPASSRQTRSGSIPPPAMELGNQAWSPWLCFLHNSIPPSVFCLKEEDEVSVTK